MPDDDFGYEDVEYSDDEKKAIVRYLSARGREKIAQAGVRTVDLWASFFCHELEAFGADKEAQELYDSYERKA